MHQTNDENNSEKQGDHAVAELHIKITAFSEPRRRWRRTISVSILLSLQSHVRDRKTVDQIMEQKNLNLLQQFGGTQKVAAVLGSDLNNGIGEGRRYPQVYNPVRSKSFFRFFLEACNSYTIFLLLISSALSFALEIMKSGPRNGWHEGVTILIAVFLLVTVPSAAKYRRSRKLKKKLLQNNNTVELIVKRGGVEQQVPISDIVEGDIVNLKEGQRVPADGLFVESGRGLVLDEVLNSKIDCNSNPFLFSGSKVIQGHGRMLVTSVGTNTVLGKMMKLVTPDPNEKTLLQAQIDKPNVYTDKISVSASVVIVFVLLLRFLCRKHHDDENGFPELKGKASVEHLMHIFERFLLKPRGTICILTSSLTAVVIGLQQGMPFVITFSLSNWNDKVTSDQTQTQNLSACGTMGLVSVICIDATGGLMCVPMEIDRFLIGEKDISSDENSETAQVIVEALSHGVGASIPVSESPVCQQAQEILKTWVKSKWEFPEQSFTVLHSEKLRTNERCSGILLRKNGNDEEILHLHWKGDAMAILGMCSQYYDSGGEVHDMENQKSRFEELIKDMEANGCLKPMALACKQTEVKELSQEGLNLLAIVSFRCPRLAETMRKLESAGVSIKVVSGDKLCVSKDIACKLGVFRPGTNDVALNGEEFKDLLQGEEFQNLPRDMRLEILDQISVLGSALPEHKLMMVKCLKQRGHVVAFGGGMTACDTPILKEADVGFCVETLCTEMATQSSDIVIKRKCLGPLIPISQSGRCAYHNIRMFIQLELTAWISGLLISSIATMCLGETPLAAIQLFWVNFIICILGFPMLLMEPVSPELMTKQPAKRTDSILTRQMLRNTVIQVSYQSIVLLILQFLGVAVAGINKDVRAAMIFNSFTLCQVFNQFNAMDLTKKEVLKAVVKNYKFPVAVGVVVAVQALTVEFGTSLAGCARLNWAQWAGCFLIAALSWAFEPAVKSVSLLLDWSSFGSIGSHIGSFPRMPRHLPRVSHLGFLFSMSLFFSVSYYFTPDIARAFR